jgi:hypothetical protein
VYVHEFAYQRGKPQRWVKVMPLKKSFSREFAAFILDNEMESMA